VVEKDHQPAHIVVEEVLKNVLCVLEKVEKVALPVADLDMILFQNLNVECAMVVVIKIVSHVVELALKDVQFVWAEEMVFVQHAKGREKLYVKNVTEKVNLNKNVQSAMGLQKFLSNVSHFAWWKRHKAT
jgi:hypothetical protein